jgi:hypothetical protein
LSALEGTQAREDRFAECVRQPSPGRLRNPMPSLFSSADPFQFCRGGRVEDCHEGH